MNSRAVVSLRFEKDYLDIRLAVSTNADLSNPVYSNSYPTANNLVKVPITGLTPDTQYYYGVLINGRLQLNGRGSFRTFPESAKSFTCAFGSCAENGSRHPVFTSIQNLNPNFFIHMGDIHYKNISVNDVNLYREAYDQVLMSHRQAALYRNVPTVYMWDDHDFGPNNSYWASPSREAACLSYRERVPHYPLPAGATGANAVYQSFVCGRVRFIVTDCRSEKAMDTGSGTDWTMFSPTQEAWFFAELLKPEPFKVWVNTLPWIGNEDGGDAGEGWMGTNYRTHRTKIANFIKDNNLEGKVAILSGDMHGIAIDDGTNSDYADGGGASVPVFQAAPLDRSESTKGGPWSHGSFLNGNAGGQFGLMEVTDTGGAEIGVTWKGYRANATTGVLTELVAHSFTVTGDMI